MGSLLEKYLKITFLTDAPFIVKSRFENYRYLLTYLLCIKIFEAPLSDGHSTGPQKMHTSRTKRRTTSAFVCLVCCYRHFVPKYVMKVKLTVRPNYRRGLLWGPVVTNNAAFEESQYSPNAHWKPPTKIVQTAELGTGKGKASKMPDFELEPVRLSSQDKTLDEKFARNLQREERQPETEFNQAVGGVLAPSGSTSSSSPKST